MSKNAIAGCALFVIGLVLGADLRQTPAANAAVAPSTAPTAAVADSNQMRAMVREELRSVLREELPTDGGRDVYSHALGSVASSAAPAPTQVAQ
jgi:hypothetical protein